MALEEDARGQHPWEKIGIHRAPNDEQQNTGTSTTRQLANASAHASAYPTTTTGSNPPSKDLEDWEENSGYDLAQGSSVTYRPCAEGDAWSDDDGEETVQPKTKSKRPLASSSSAASASTVSANKSRPVPYPQLRPGAKLSSAATSAAVATLEGGIASSMPRAEPLCSKPQSSPTAPAAAEHTCCFDFDSMGISPHVLRGIQAKGFETPSDVQANAIPALLSRKDCVAQAPSGSGKTLSFAVPALEVLQSPTTCPPDSLPSPRVLVVTPTGVLANQIADVFRNLSQFMSPPPRVALLTGGTHLTARCLDVVVATPLKLLDLLGLTRDARPPRLALDQVELCVLDEADELLDKVEFQEQLSGLVRQLPKSCVMSYFSATMSRATMELIKQERLVRPDRVAYVTAGDGVRPAIAHFHVHIGDCPEDQVWEVKAGVLSDLCEEFQGGAVIIFSRSKAKRDFLAKVSGADRPGSRFTTDGDKFLGMKTGVLLATDAYSRGFDVQHVAAVFSFEPAKTPALYTQRVGRAGRFGRSGTAITLVDDQEDRDLKWLQRDLGFDIPVLSGDLSTLPGAGSAESQAQAPVRGGGGSGVGQTGGGVTPAPLHPAPAREEPPPPTHHALNAAWVEKIIDGVAAQLMPQVTAVINARVANAESKLGERIDTLAHEVTQSQRQLDAAPKCDPAFTVRLAHLEDDIAGLRQDVLAGLAECKDVRALAGSLRETSEAMAVLVEPARRTPALPVPIAAGQEPPRLTLASSCTSLTSLSSQSASGLTTVDTAQTSPSWASRVAAHHKPEPWVPAPSSKARSTGAATSTRARPTLGSDSFSAAQVRVGQTYQGQVIKVLPSKRGGYFVRFGDEKAVCDRDGFARFKSPGESAGTQAGLKVGAWVKVAVCKVQPPKEEVSRWRVDLCLV